VLVDDAESPHGSRVVPELSNLDLVGCLKQNGCTGVLWLRTVDRVVSYGTGTLRRQMVDGSVNSKLARLRCPIRLGPSEREHLRAHPHERDDLVQDAVFAGLVRLRDRGILGGEWDPAKGADLMTYFVNGCLLSLPNPMREWRRQRTAAVPTITYDAADLDALRALTSLEADPVWSIQDRDALEELLAGLPPTIVDVARSVACDGLNWADACRRHRLSPRLVEGHLRRYRRRYRRPEEY
jgi:DNA-directed RNA polymerase specialized sigma24 family protein